jgi:predicted negative regulator of RcsB-dependent stress response
MRLQEAERRARVEGEMRINEERMRLEIQHKKRNSPVKAVISVAVDLIAVAGGLGYKMWSQNQLEQARAQAELESARAEAKRTQAELESKLAGIQKDMNDRLASAKSEEERAKIRADAALARAQAQAAQAHAKPSHAASKSDTDRPTRIKNVQKHEISDNPLEGL